MSHGLSREEITRRVRESRAEQGLPPTIQDPATLAHIVTLVRDTRPEGSRAAA